MKLQRREFLRRASALGLLGSASPLAMNLAAIGEAAAATSPGDYKALVCVFLAGGNDQSNMLVPCDADNYKAYAGIRPTLATPQAQLLPLGSPLDGRQMALAPQMGRLQQLFGAGRLGVQANVGTLLQPTTLAQYKARSVPLPPQLFSHIDQTNAWQALSPGSVASGWGGRVGDRFLASNGKATFTCINMAGNALFMTGQQALQYQMTPAGAIAINGIAKPMFGSQACSDALRSLVTDGSRSHWMEQELNRVTRRMLDAQSTVAGALAGVPAMNTAFSATNTLARQLGMVAKLIAARSALGASRQVFFVSLGGFDLHSNLAATHPGLLSSLSEALGSFHDATVELGVADQVTTFTASEFGRTLSSNGDGSDHGWGSHHFVMGGAVQGGRIWGALPSISVSGPDDVGQGRLLPSTAADQMAGALASWMGVGGSDLQALLPQLKHFDAQLPGYFG